ncbi:MAG: hypothetical protein H0Z19_11820 [Archaeoglobus sp.]|uniref:hypothetical protein n=1 Tax=Archaeoglobus sp. TaxID=1872626 RepID=UPI001D963F0A|nr:hypothetical protein [Archaeoglobus sp.]MBO8181136.1 hypothetical protein [Archaeoglobus sp.]
MRCDKYRISKLADISKVPGPARDILLKAAHLRDEYKKLEKEFSKLEELSETFNISKETMDSARSRLKETIEELNYTLNLLRIMGYFDGIGTNGFLYLFRIKQYVLCFYDRAEGFVLDIEILKDTPTDPKERIYVGRFVMPTEDFFTLILRLGEKIRNGEADELLNC